MIYLDNAATTLQKPAEVEAAVIVAMQSCANAGRGGHSAAMKAAEKLFDCREAAAELFGLDNPERVVFTFNTTHGLNIAIKGIMQGAGHCVISSFEHNSVTRPLKAMEKNGVSFTIANSPLFNPEKTVKAIEKALRSDTKCIVCTHVSNVFGYRLPIEEIDALAYSKGIPIILDAAQSAGCVDIKMNRFKAVKCICMPGHKGLYGPQGTGLLLVEPDSALPSFMEGGTGSLSGDFNQPDFWPDRHESGTQNIHGIAGLCEGIKYIMRVGVDKIREHEQMLISKAKEHLMDVPGITLYSTDEKDLQTGVLSFNVEGKSSEVIAAMLGELEIAVRGGFHCSPLAHKSAGTLYGTVRMSVSWFNDEDDIYRFVCALKEIL